MTIGDAVVLVNRVGCRKHTHKLLIEVFRSFTTRRTTTAIIFLIRIYVAANKISSSNGVINNWCLVYVKYNSLKLYLIFLLYTFSYFLCTFVLLLYIPLAQYIIKISKNIISVYYKQANMFCILNIKKN